MTATIFYKKMNNSDMFTTCLEKPDTYDILTQLDQKFY